MEHSNEVSITDSKRVPRAASADTQVPQADGCAESSRPRYADLARSFNVNGEQRYRRFGGRPARLPVDGVRLIARRRDSRVCAHEPPRPAATPLKVPATVACGGSAEQDRDGNRAKRNPAPIPANPHGHWENSDFGEVPGDCKSRRFPFSQGPAAAPHADQTNRTTAGSNYNAMKPKRPVPAQSRPTARQTDRRAPGDAPDRAKRNPAPIPANPHGHWENSDFGEVRCDCKFPRFPCSQGPAAAPPADQTNNTTAGSNYNAMKPKRPVPAQSRPTARQTDSPRARATPPIARNGIRLRSPQTRMGTGKTAISERSGAIASSQGSHAHKDQPRHCPPTRRTTPRLAPKAPWNLNDPPRRRAA